MKNIISILVYLASISTVVNAQWHQVFSSNNSLYGIDFISPSTGWVVGDLGVILKTTDEGQNWNSQIIGALTLLVAVDFIDSTNGWIVGEFGTILKTTDAGINWVQQTSSTSEMLRDVNFIDTSLGWVIGSNGTILKTSNGGDDWISQSSLVSYDFMALSFWDKNHGIVVGNWNNGSNIEGVIYRTTNSGNSWITETIGVPSNLTDVTYSDSNNAYVVGDRILKHTSNSGLSWNNQIYNSDHTLLGISFVDSITGWVVGANSLIINTLNGGNEWRLQNNNIPVQFLGNVKLLNKMNGYAISYYGEIYKTSNGGYTRNLELLTPTGGENWIAGSGEYIIWTSNDVYTITLEYSTDNGKHWNIISEGCQNTGSYQWTVPNIVSDSVLVRVTDSEYNLLSNVNDHVFSITQPNDTNDDQELFLNYFISQNYPNPFNPSTTIEYQIPQSSFVTIKVYDALGKEVVTLANEEKPAGIHEVNFEPKNLTSGLYLYKISSDGFEQTRKMLFLK
jgi:photosystem II stability/assembly factor-like uncharacterized protein